MNKTKAVLLKICQDFCLYLIVSQAFEFISRLAFKLWICKKIQSINVKNNILTSWNGFRFQ